jgi:AAA domain
MMTPEEDAAFRAAAGEDSAAVAVEVDSVEAFAAVKEPGATPLVGDNANVLIPEGGDVMVYGDGGAGKTTLLNDAAFHLAAGQAWLGLPVPRPLTVLLVEVEGPRPLMRAKLRRKLAAWAGEPIEGRLLVLAEPWATFTFAEESCRVELARIIREHEVDIVIAGPLTRVGMDEAGTLQQVRDFTRLVHDVRERSGRRPAIVLVHHQNRAGAVSGAWEGAGDTLLHVMEAGPGHTVVHFQKARWSSKHHGSTLKLTWTPGEGYELEAERDLLAEIKDLLADGKWRTLEEIRGGVGAGRESVRELLAQAPDEFVMRTGEEARAVGRRPNSTVYQLTHELD